MVLSFEQSKRLLQAYAGKPFDANSIADVHARQKCLEAWARARHYLATAK